MAKIENPAPQTNVTAPFNALCYGARFRYRPDTGKVWVKIGHDLIAEWDASKVADEWIGQSICSFTDDGDFIKTVYLVSDPAPQTNVRVKSLEWRKFQPKHRVQEETVADTPFGRYSIVFIGEWQLYWNRAKKPMSRHETAVAAMEAAQADHDKRVLALISTRASTGPTKADSGAAVIDAEGLLFAANALLNSLWEKVYSGLRTHEENWAEFERQFPGARLLHDAHRAVTAAPSPAP